MARNTVKLMPGDARIVIDIHNDFLPGGALPVPRGDEVVPVLNRYLELFQDTRLPIFATRDWHPADQCSFRAQGGPWPPHCVVQSPGAAFAADLRLPPDVPVICKARFSDAETYSDFDGTGLAQLLWG